ncbi:hypothetical protein HN011_007845 [Eciton burchellii]|nr:hypothetical protein HN011_007845 [Eciton burchellii]
MNYDVRDEESRYFAWPRDALKIAMQPMLFPTRGAIASRRRAILRSSHDPDYDGEFARLLEQLLTTGCRSRGDARALARAFWRLGGSGPYRVSGALRTLASEAICTENSRHVGRNESRNQDCIYLKEVSTLIGNADAGELLKKSRDRMRAAFRQMHFGFGCLLIFKLWRISAGFLQDSKLNSSMSIA